MKPLRDMTPDELAEVDRKLSRQPAEPILQLWEDLRDVGGMPPMQPEHFRAMAWALLQAYGRGVDACPPTTGTR